MRATCLTAAAVIGLVSFAGSSDAHQQWLAPNFVFDPGDSAWLSFDHTFGDRRFQASSGPSSYYSWWIVGPDGLKRSVPHMFLGKTRTVGEIELTDAGTYRIEALEDMMPWTRIKSDGEESWQPGTRADFEGSEIVRSTVYFSKAVSYVSLKSTSRAPLASTGEPLEILFDEHPNDLRGGERFQVRVVAFGEPLANQEVRVFAEYSEGHDATETCSTDANGFCRLELPAPGRYLLATNAEGENSGDAVTDGYSHGYSVLIELKVAGASADAGDD